MQDIRLIEILSDNVYIEYEDNDSEYVSFTKAKKLLRESKAQTIVCSSISANSQRAVDFINRITFRTKEYKNNKTYLNLKDTKCKTAK